MDEKDLSLISEDERTVLLGAFAIAREISGRMDKALGDSNGSNALILNLGPAGSAHYVFRSQTTIASMFVDEKKANDKACIEIDRLLQDVASPGAKELARDSFESAKLTTGEFNEP